MLRLTDGAAARLRRMLDRLEAGPRASVRVRTVQRGLLIDVDERRPDDLVVEHGGRPLLVCDPRSAHRLSGRILDAERTPRGDVLVFC